MRNEKSVLLKEDLVKFKFKCFSCQNAHWYGLQRISLNSNSDVSHVKMGVRASRGGRAGGRAGAAPLAASLP